MVRKRVLSHILGGIALAAVAATPAATIAQGGSADDASLEFLREQLTRARAVTPSAADTSSREAIQAESERLLAEESALLNQLGGGDQPPPSAPPSRARATRELDKTLDALTDPSPSSSESPDDFGIEVVRGSIPSVRESSPAPAAAALIDRTIEVAPPPVSDAQPMKASLDVDELPSHVSSREEPAEAEPAVAALVRNAEESDVEHERVSLPSSTDRELAAKLESSSQTIAGLQRTNGDLRRQLDSTQRKLRESSKEIEETRNRLIIAETEVERLSNLLEQRNRSTMVRVAPEVAAASGAQVRSYKAPQNKEAQKSASPAPRAEGTAKITSDMLIATVMADKAHLRTGPGKNNSPLMSVSRGTRLAVETRSGEWYRVITPAGTRAWVSAEVVSFGADPQGSPTRTVRVGGYEAGGDRAISVVRP